MPSMKNCSMRPWWRTDSVKRESPGIVFTDLALRWIMPFSSGFQKLTSVGGVSEIYLPTQGMRGEVGLYRACGLLLSIRALRC